VRLGFSFKLKSFFTANKTVTRLKIQFAEWEKIFTNHTSDKGITRICRELKKPTPQRINNGMKEWVIEMNRQFSKEELNT
jgi:hypothetical protein